MANPGLPFNTALRIGPLRIGIRTNHRAHIPEFPHEIEVKSLLTDFHRIEVIPCSEDLDGYIHIWEEAGVEPRIQKGDRAVDCRGPFLSLADKAADDRYSFWGNLGLLYHYALSLMESRHGIYSLHACALFDPDTRTLFVAAGGAGSGKTVYLLSGITRGLALFSTETVHLQVRDDGIFWHIGSLVDNVRWGTLLHDFPRFKPDSPPPPTGDRVWQEKLALDLSGHRWTEDVLRSPTCVFLFPHIEQGRGDFEITSIQEPEAAIRLVFDNVSEKISQSFVLYGAVAVSGFDRDDAARKRLAALRRLIMDPSVRLVATVLADPEHCWGNLLPENPSQGENT